MHPHFHHEQLAFDVGAYQTISPVNIASAISQDLAALTFETHPTKPIHERIGFTNLKVKGDRIVQSGRDEGKDVREYFNWSSPDNRFESGINSQFIEVLASSPESTVGLWISPPGGPKEYPDGKTLIGISTRENGDVHIEEYEVPCVGQDEKWYLEADRLLSAYAYNQAESLRETIFIQVPWEVLEQIITFPKVLETIKSGLVKKYNTDTQKDLADLAQEYAPKILAAKDRRTRLQIGAEMEIKASRLTGAKYSGSGCGMSNAEALNAGVSYTVLNNNGEVVVRKKFIRSCGVCKRSINKFMGKGERCPYKDCNCVYQGC